MSRPSSPASVTTAPPLPEGAALTVRLPRRLDPYEAPLGRWLRRRHADPLQAEVWTLVGLVFLGLFVLTVQYATWVVGQPLLAEPEAAAWLWGVQATVLIGAVVVGLAGRSPETVFAWDATLPGLRVQQGSRTLTIPRADVAGAELISGQLYHRHYRRYAATCAFVHRVPATLLLVHTPDGPVVLGPPTEAQHQFLALLTEAP